MTLLALDSTVLIYVLNAEAPLHQAALELLESVEAGRHHAVWSTLAVAEVLVHPIASGQADYISRARQLVLDFPNSQVVPVSASVADYGAGLRARFPSLKLPDALHLATAVISKTGTFVTNDAQLIKLSIKELTIRQLGS